MWCTPFDGSADGASPLTAVPIFRPGAAHTQCSSGRISHPQLDASAGMCIHDPPACRTCTLSSPGACHATRSWGLCFPPGARAVQSAVRRLASIVLAILRHLRQPSRCLTRSSHDTTPTPHTQPLRPCLMQAAGIASSGGAVTSVDIYARPMEYKTSRCSDTMRYSDGGLAAPPPPG
jgi:hypothetical protein